MQLCCRCNITTPIASPCELDSNLLFFVPLRYFDEEELTDIPLFVSGTLVDQSGRTLSGQTTEVY